MSMTFNMVGGGGSGIPGNRAVLVARIPSGSTVTATKGGVTLTPMMWVSETYPDQDIALFVFTPAQFDSVNPWTITATDGTNSTSDTIVIDSNKEYEMELSYSLYLYNRGNECEAVTNGWTAKTYYSSATFNSGEVTFTNGDSSGHTSIYTNNTIALTGMNKLCISLKQNTTYGNFGICSSIGNWNPSYVAQQSLSQQTGEQTLQLDISSYNSGMYYAAVNLRNGSLYELWLEK